MKQLLLILAAGFAVAACGGVPGNSVATVDGEPIAKQDFDHWMTVTSRLNDPKAKLPKAGSKEYNAQRDQVVSMLVSFAWIDREAERLEVKTTDAEVKKSFDEQRKQAFPKDADYRAFLKNTTQTEADIVRRVRLDLLANKIQQHVVKGKDKVSEQAISDFYAKNKTRFAQPEKRDLRVVLTKTKKDADRAYAALERGDSWKAVTKRYSIDDTSKATGGKLPAQAEGTLDAELDKAVFGARKGELDGPIKTQYGYYVFTVTDVIAASQQTLAEAKPTIQQTLASEKQQKALTTFMTDFNKRWRAETECAEGYKTADCSNGPKPTPTPTMG